MRHWGLESNEGSTGAFAPARGRMVLACASGPIH